MFSKFFIFIKSMSVAAKVVVVTSAVAIVGGTTAVVVVINQPKVEPEIVSSEPKQNQQQGEGEKDIKPDEGQEEEKKTEEKKNEVAVKEEKKTEENKEQKAEKKEENETEKKEENISAKPTTSETPEVKKTCSDLKNCDYNLNEKFVIETDTYNYYALPEGVSSLCEEYEPGKFYLDKLQPRETKTFFQIGHFTGKGGGTVPHVTPDRTQNTWKQAENYGNKKNLQAHHKGWGCGGMGDTVRDWTWQETINKGYALDESKCKQWGLSCGRW